MYLLFQGIFIFGQPLQTGIAAAFSWLRDAALVPLLGGLPQALQGFLLDGIYNGVGHRRGFRADHRAVLSVHGDGGRQRLPVARGIFDGCADGAPGAGRARLRDAADGLRLQRARADGHPRDALARDAFADDAGDPVLAVLGAPAGVHLLYRRAVLGQGRAGRAVQPVPVQLRRRDNHCADLQEPLQEHRAVRAGTAALPLPHRSPDGAARLGGSAPLPAPRHQVHRRRRGDGVAAHPSAAVRSAGQCRYLSPA